MIFKHGEYLTYDLPKNWCAEKSDDNLIIYNPDGNGAITVSFFNVIEPYHSLDEQVSISAKNFIVQNNIDLHSPFILLNKDSKTILYSTGTTDDDCFIKIWLVAKHPKIVFATYLSEKKNKEVKICDSIIDSIKFTY